MRWVGQGQQAGGSMHHEQMTIGVSDWWMAESGKAVAGGRRL